MSKKQSEHRFRAIAVTALLIVGSWLAVSTALAAGHQGLAGQMCPQGAYVIGFDGEGNIVCSQVCGNGRLDAGEACDDGNTLGGDGCSAACQPETAATTAAPAAVVAAPVASQAAPAAAAPTAPAAPQAAPAAEVAAPAGAAAVATMSELAITDVDPSSVVYGTRETTITISGTGFNAETVVLFDGSTYRPSVNAAGTELEVTLPTRDLAMGRYPLKVSNGLDAVVKWKKPLVVY